MKRKQIIKPTAKFVRMIMMVFLQLILLTGLIDYANAQEINPYVVSSGGETFTASGISLDFVIGEIVTESYTEGSTMLTQGFLQGTEEGLAIYNQSANADDIVVFPNPVSNIVNIMCKGEDKPMYIEIIDIQGCKISSIQNANNPLPINIECLTPGLYVVKLIFPDHNSVTKRIIKK